MLKLKNKLLPLGVLLFILFTAGQCPAAEKIAITGSTTVYPIAKKAAEAYMRLHPGVDIRVTGTGSGDGITALINGKTDIADSSRWIKDKEIRMALEKGILPVPFQVAYDCILPVIHPSNPIQDISMEILRKVYTGQIKNWKALGWKDSPIRVYTRDTSSGTFGVWKKKVMQGMTFSPDLKLTEGNPDMVKSLAADETGIGYIGIGHLDKSVKALRVDGILGSSTTALDGTYPIARPLFMLTKGWPAGDVKKFINFVLEPGQGQRIVKQVGYLALYNSQNILPAPAAPAPGKTTTAAGTADVTKPAFTLYRDYMEMGWHQKVKRLQQNLHNLGYNTGPVDGVWGPKTLRAFNAFLQDNHMNPDGIVTYERLQMMELNLNEALFKKLRS